MIKAGTILGVCLAAPAVALPLAAAGSPVASLEGLGTWAVGAIGGAVLWGVVRVKDVGTELAVLKQRADAHDETLERIDGKLDRLLERGAGKGGA